MSKSGRKRKPKPITVATGQSLNLLVRPTEVDDPYETGKPLIVMKNMRVTSLDFIHSRGRLGHLDNIEHKHQANARKLAGDKFQGIFEQAQIGGAKAFDYSALKVDTSFVHRGIDESVMIAVATLSAIRTDVGKHYFDLLWHIIGLNRSIFDLASSHDGNGISSRETRRELYHELRLALDALIDFFGVAKGRAPSIGTVRDSERLMVDNAAVE